MNAFLARGLGGINIVIALLIVGLATLVGGLDAMKLIKVSSDPDKGWLVFAGAAIGFVAGSFVACLVCGAIAVQIGIYNELRLIRQRLAFLTNTSVNDASDASARPNAGSGSAARHDPWF